MPDLASLLTGLAALYGGASSITYVLYTLDKSAAIAQRRRIAERTLLLWGLCGGWPGAWLAQQTLRHKTRKLPFLLLFWLSVMLNLALLTGCMRFYFTR
ncbi:DUF1294 domain-containing protein [Duganella qianjiadongensis]|uniref:DUF1294 domain-containing protein n=1 Tax=Duganella qianjiadongensis TaxID=2692176 RepID=A0ABW9VE73_9BURK|nr:DUF1294 domain-containing protein [Duganella qianjiadongensis]MYM37773.1 DUF1294 domain-containing protein [Duganella qianjiadongensis]